MSVTAVVPARGGSKGVPGKNLREVGGVPLVARAIRAALDTAGVDEVAVSTDDERIALIALAEGARVIDRPAELASDTASSESALLHALDSSPHPIDVLVFLQATSPFLDTAALEDAVRRVRDGDEDVVFSAVPTHVFLWRVGEEGASGVNHDPAHRPRRQDREPEWAETGAFYVMNGDGFRAARHRFFGRVGIAEVDPRTALEIDTPDDLELAEGLAWGFRDGASRLLNPQNDGAVSASSARL